MLENQIKSFVRERLDHMYTRPEMYAGTKESFILQLMLLAEVSWIGVSEPNTNRSNFLMRDLCGIESGCIVPRDQIDKEWAKERVDIARKYTNL